MGDITETERHERGKVREQSGGGGGGRGRGRELAQMRLALTQQDILSHTLHMSSPILSQNQHWSYSVENRPTLPTDETTDILWWCGAARPKTTIMSTKISQQQNYFKGLTLALALTIGQGLACDGKG